MKSFKLRMTGRQHATLHNHLFPGDGKEAIAFALCGVGKVQEKEKDIIITAIHEIHPIPYDKCSEREEDRVTWSSEIVAMLLNKARKKGLVLLKIHSHPTGCNQFSEIDDISDISLFTRIEEWLEKDYSGMSAVMLPNGKIFARAFIEDTKIHSVDSVLIAGADIKQFHHSNNDSVKKEDNEELYLRLQQTLGEGTTNILKRMTIGVVGASGTGSPLIEQLYRLGVGEIIIVDPDIVKQLNLGRIYNSTTDDALKMRKKVEVIKEAIERSGLPTQVTIYDKSLFNKDVINGLAQCDIIFGCMDSVEGRDVLNKLSSAYCIPYFDLGCIIKADGKGNVDQIAGAVHYLQPDGSSLQTRHVYSSKKLTEESMKRVAPDQYQVEKKQGYIHGVDVDQPAVISLNTLMASLAMLDFKSRIHDIRLDRNSDIDCIRVSITNGQFKFENSNSPICPVLNKYVGLCDQSALLQYIIFDRVVKNELVN
jgi:hypothetical protein